MKGDSVVIEPHHERAAADIVAALLPVLRGSDKRFAISVAGQSGSGKTETATAVGQALEARGLISIIFHQDDYFVYPPRSNDAARRADIGWVGTGEVRLDLMDEHIRAFLAGAASIEKPLVDYATDSIGTETMPTEKARVALADGTYTTQLKNVDCRVFIDRDFRETRAHREKRKRDESELDPFIDRVLAIEHDIISAHRARADIVVNKNYSVSLANPEFTA